MNQDLQLVALVGSLRAGSLNRSVFESAVELLPTGIRMHARDLSDVPFYNGDVEASGDPVAVTALKRAVSEADGLVVFTPEYNRSVPAVTKNAVDWLSRPRGANPLTTTPVGIVAVTAGDHTAAGVREHLAQSVRAITELLFTESLGIGAGAAGSAEAGARNELAGWLQRFVAYAAQERNEGKDKEVAA